MQPESAKDAYKIKTHNFSERMRLRPTQKSSSNYFCKDPNVRVEGCDRP
jgi:hypothetical protein